MNVRTIPLRWFTTMLLGLGAVLVSACAGGPTVRLIHSQLHGTFEDATLSDAVRKTSEDLTLHLMSLNRRPSLAVLETLPLPAHPGEAMPDYAVLGEILSGRLAESLNGDAVQARQVDFHDLIADPDAYHKVPDHLKGKVLSAAALEQSFSHVLVSNVRKQDDGLILHVVLQSAADGEPRYQKTFRLTEDPDLWMALGKSRVLNDLPAPFRTCSLDTPKTRSENLKRAMEQGALTLEAMPDNRGNKICLRLGALKTPAAVKEAVVVPESEKPKNKDRAKRGKNAKRGKKGKAEAPALPAFVERTPLAEPDGLVCFRIHSSDSGVDEDPYPPSSLTRNGQMSNNGVLLKDETDRLTYTLDAWADAPLDVELLTEQPFPHTGSQTPRALYVFATLNGKDLRSGRYLSPREAGWWRLETSVSGLQVSYYGQNESPDTHLRFVNLERSLADRLFGQRRHGVLSFLVFVEPDHGCSKGAHCSGPKSDLPCRLTTSAAPAPAVPRKASGKDTVNGLPDGALPLALFSIRYDAPSKEEKLRREEEARRRLEEERRK